MINGTNASIPGINTTSPKKVSFTGVKVTPAGKDMVKATFSLPKSYEEAKGITVFAAGLIAFVKGTVDKIQKQMEKKTPDGQFETELMLPSNKTYQYQYAMIDNTGNMLLVPDEDKNINSKEPSEFNTFYNPVQNVNLTRTESTKKINELPGTSEELSEISTPKDAFYKLIELLLKVQQHGVEDPQVSPGEIERYKNEIFESARRKYPKITEDEIHQKYIPSLTDMILGKEKNIDGTIKTKFKLKRLKKLSIYDLATLKLIENKFNKETYPDIIEDAKKLEEKMKTRTDDPNVPDIYKLVEDYQNRKHEKVQIPDLFELEEQYQKESTQKESIPDIWKMVDEYQRLEQGKRETYPDIFEAVKKKAKFLTEEDILKMHGMYSGTEWSDKDFSKVRAPEIKITEKAYIPEEYQNKKTDSRRGPAVQSKEPTVSNNEPAVLSKEPAVTTEPKTASQVQQNTQTNTIRPSATERFYNEVEKMLKRSGKDSSEKSVKQKMEQIYAAEPDTPRIEVAKKYARLLERQNGK